MASDGIKTIVRWKGNAKIVRFEDSRLATAVERFLAEEPQRIVLTNLDAPPGTYEVESRSAPGGCWEVRLDPRSGVHVGNHTCPYRAENPKDYRYPCIHIAGAWLKWRADMDANSEYTRRIEGIRKMADTTTETEDAKTSTALAVRRDEETGLAYYVPSKEHVQQTLTLANVLFKTRGGAIPNSVKTVEEAAAIIMAGEALGMDPNTAFRRIFTVNGRTQPDSQAMAALVQASGSDIIYHESTDEKADVEIVTPGRASVRVVWTIEQARKAGLLTKEPWQKYPADMLVWKAVARCARRGRADAINGIGTAMVEVADFEDAARQMGGTYTEEHTERQALPVIDEETGEIQDATFTNEEEPPSPAEAESPTASADTPSESTTSERPGPEASDSGMDVQQETPGPASSADAPSTSASDTQEKSPMAVGGSPTTSNTTDPKAMTYRQAKAKPADNIPVLSRFQRAIRGKGDLPNGHQDMTLDAIVTAMGGSWPE